MKTLSYSYWSFIFFFNDTATTEIYTLSLHDALPILGRDRERVNQPAGLRTYMTVCAAGAVCALLSIFINEEVGSADMGRDRKSTRLNSSHANISYAVFCLKKKKFTDSSIAPDKLVPF